MSKVSYIKYGGLLFSAFLTIALFVRLFGSGPYGVLMGIAALVMFEGGAVAWELTLPEAKNRQRNLVRLALGVCVATSILSSGAEIILSTGLWKPPFDIQFYTLAVIVVSLAVNVAGGIGYYILDPEVEKKNVKADREAAALKRERAFEDQVVNLSLDKAEKMVEDIAEGVAGKLAEEVKEDVIRHLLAQTRGGLNSLPRPNMPTYQPSRPVYQPQASISEGQFHRPAPESVPIKIQDEDYPVPIASKPTLAIPGSPDRRNGSQPEEDTKNRGKGWTQSELG